MPRIAVVDAENRFLRWADRETVHAAHLFHRTVHVLLSDGAGRLVLQRRHAEKLTHPSHWDLSCAGHVEEEDGDPKGDIDANYDRAVRRELFEELGVRPPMITRVGLFPPVPGVHYEHIALYRTTSDGPFTLQADEVEELRHVTRDELEQVIAREKVTETLVYFARFAF